MSLPKVDTLLSAIRASDKAALARAITIIESSHSKHQAYANALLDLCLPFAGNSIRIGVTGVPGVGKSTFINALGNILVNDHQKRVAVLAIDPSSQQTGGSILGDKTRMQDLVGQSDVFIRPSPSGNSLGGVAATTQESIALCEAAGYDVILIETVGVGQSETLVHQMVDFFLLLLLPGAGDDLQGIKRGVVEMADAIVVNKSEINPPVTKEAVLHYKRALELMHSPRENWKVPVLQSDAVASSGITEVWGVIQNFVAEQNASGALKRNRIQQQRAWFEKQVELTMLRNWQDANKLEELKAHLLNNVVDQKQAPRSAATEFVKQLFQG